MGITVELLRSLQVGLDRDLRWAIPELTLAAGIVLLLLARMIIAPRHLHVGWIAIPIAWIATVVALAQFIGIPEVMVDEPLGSGGHFTDLVTSDMLARFLRIVLLVYLSAGLMLSRITGMPDADDAADFCTMMLGSTLGMLLMVQSQHLLMIFLAVEMASLPSYALAGFLKGKRQGSESALKYVIFGATASGTMLYGISLLTSRFGTGDLIRIAAALQSSNGSEMDLIVIAGTLFIVIGLCFKLSAVPAHFWCPDVFTGAAAEVGAFLSIASKAAAVGLTARITWELTQGNVLGSPFSQALGIGLIIISMLTMTLGNLGAYGQTNIKRLMAYSTIAHAGYLLMGLATLQREGTSAVLFYLAMYLLMNLGAFTVIALVRDRLGSEDVDAYRGLITRWPVAAIVLTVCLMSLLGLPPLAGFLAKYQVFASVLGTARAVSASNSNLAAWYYAMLFVGAINTVLSAVYYLRIVRLMILEPAPESDSRTPMRSIRLSPFVGMFLTMPALLLLLFGVFGDSLMREARMAAYNEATPQTRTFASPSIQEKTRP